MPAHAPARRRTTHGAATRRTTVSPRHARRVSGPVARPVPVPAGRAASLPRRGQTGVFERLRALPEHRVVDRLLRGRAWIWLIGVMLGGIVAMQVSLLGLNSGISRAVEKTGALERQNAELEAAVAQLSSGERVQAAAIKEGMVTPPAGDVGFLTVRPGVDGERAARRMQPPSDEARQVMANGGRSLEAVVPATVVAEAPVTTTAPPPAAETAPAPVPTPTPTTAPAPVQPAQPVQPETMTAAPADPATGAAAAPTGG
jgi:hypothetical protein